MYLSKFDDQSSEEISVNVTGKMIAQKNISKTVGYVPNKELYRLAMDGNTAVAEQLAARTKMDCITHTIFLADGAFLEPIANVFMRIIPEISLKAIR